MGVRLPHVCILVPQMGIKQRQLGTGGNYETMARQHQSRRTEKDRHGTDEGDRYARREGCENKTRSTSHRPYEENLRIRIAKKIMGGGVTMSKRTKRIMRSIKKHLQALGYLCLLCMIALGLGKLIYETGFLLMLDAILGAIFG